jgi:hypothetical protein
VVAEWVRQQEEKAAKEREKWRRQATAAWRQLLSAGLVKVRLAQEYEAGGAQAGQAGQGQGQGQSKARGGGGGAAHEVVLVDIDGRQDGEVVMQGGGGPGAAEAEAAGRRGADGGIDYEEMGVDCEEL